MVETRGQRRKAVVIQAKPLLMTHPRSCCNRNFASFFKKLSINRVARVQHWDRAPGGAGSVLIFPHWREYITGYQRQGKNRCF